MDYTFLRYNDISTEENWVQLGQYIGYSFYDIQNVMKKVQARTVYDPIPKLKNSLYQTIMFVDQTTISHGRRIYGLFDLLGDLGGVTEVIMLCFGFMLYPISEHSFHIKAIKKLFIARTKDEKLFVRKKAKSKKQRKDEADERVQQLAHKAINVSLGSSSLLYILNTFTDYFGCLFKKRTKLQKLYEIGSEKLEGEMNIVKIIKNLKFLRVLMRKHLADEKLQFEIRHDPKNVIDLDAKTEESEAAKSENSDAEKIIKAHTAADPGEMDRSQNDFVQQVDASGTSLIKYDSMNASIAEQVY